jgi:hypothetical protein
VTCQVDGSGLVHTRRCKLPTERHRVTFETAIQKYILTSSARRWTASCSFGTWNKQSGLKLGQKEVDLKRKIHWETCATGGAMLLSRVSLRRPDTLILNGEYVFTCSRSSAG